jgi:AMP nucleosidase
VEPDGVKTEESDKEVTKQWSEQHLELGINSMTEIGKSGEQIQHFRY